MRPGPAGAWAARAPERRPLRCAPGRARARRRRRERPSGGGAAAPAEPWTEAPEPPPPRAKPRRARDRGAEPRRALRKVRSAGATCSTSLPRAARCPQETGAAAARAVSRRGPRPPPPAPGPRAAIRTAAGRGAGAAVERPGLRRGDAGGAVSTGEAPGAGLGPRPPRPGRSAARAPPDAENHLVFPLTDPEGRHATSGAPPPPLAAAGSVSFFLQPAGWARRRGSPPGAQRHHGHGAVLSPSYRKATLFEDGAATVGHYTAVQNSKNAKDKNLKRHSIISVLPWKRIVAVSARRTLRRCSPTAATRTAS